MSSIMKPACFKTFLVNKCQIHCHEFPSHTSSKSYSREKGGWPYNNDLGPSVGKYISIETIQNAEEPQNRVLGSARLQNCCILVHAWPGRPCSHWSKSCVMLGIVSDISLHALQLDRSGIALLSDTE